MKLPILVLVLALTGCASEGWRYHRAPPGTYSQANLATPYGFQNKPQYQERLRGQATGRTYEQR